MSDDWKKAGHTTLSHYAHKLSFKERQFNFRHFLPLYFEPMIGDKKDVTVADLGAGLFCTIGNLWDTAVIHVSASDILADEFNAFLKEKNVKSVIPVEKQDMEHLIYPDNFFDIVHCVNALDHVQDILAVLKEMYRVCKPGGWIYLRHYPHVGEHQQYCGFHQWNLDKEGSDCRVWNKKESFYLTRYFPGFMTFVGREFAYEAKDMVISMLHKPI